MEPVIMVCDAEQLHGELERQIHVRTGRRIRELVIELLPERIVLRGRANSFYLKQLAQHGVRDVLPQARLENAIIVEECVN
jgi:hypothetical protein